jgi:DNA-binding transcriptional LysR family regulator
MRGTEFAELSAFVAVAEEASFTKAARRLALSPATLSQTVKSLEERLGVRLLNRTTRSVAPTEAGDRLLMQLRPLLDGFGAAVESVNAFRDKPTGHLRLAVPPPVSKLLIAPVLARFLTQYPDITLEILVENQYTDIVANRFDAGFRRANMIARDMVAVRVTDELCYHVAASPEYIKRRGRPSKPTDLHEHNCIRFRLPGDTFLPWAFLEGNKTIEIDVHGSVIVNEPELMTSAALDGIGIIYTIGEYVEPLISSGHLISLLDESVMPQNEGFSLFYPSRRQNPAALKVLIEFLRKEYKTRSRKSD